MTREEQQAAQEIWKQLGVSHHTHESPANMFFLGFEKACDWHRERLMQKLIDESVRLKYQMAQQYDSTILSQTIQELKI